MYSSIFFAWGLAAITVVVHAVGLALMLKCLSRRNNVPLRQLGAISARLVWVVCYMIMLLSLIHI